MIKSNDDETIIAMSKTKLVVLTAGSLAFVAAGLWFCQSRFDFVLRGVGIASVLFFGLCGAGWGWKLFDSKPGLRLSAAGIEDNSSGMSVGLIPWEEIVGFRVFESQKTRILVVLIIDPEKWIKRQGPIRQSVFKMNLRLCGSPIGITSNSLKISFDELMSLVGSYYSKYGVAWPVLPSTVPDDISIEQVPPEDEEIEDEWVHASPTQPALFVIASKWKEDSEYPWGVGVTVADLVREPSAEKILSAAIHQALMKTVGVVDVQREDADSWIVSGEPSGHDLVANVGKAVVQCIPTIIPLRKPSARII
ncbi:MAG: STM3941 family protein [Planctomycetota bacterium]